MASNSFGTLFRITTWGESHGKAIGVVIDGCPAGLELDEAVINAALSERAPGKSPFTSPRKEPDVAEILSGVFEGVTTGAPISILIPNRDSDSSKYQPIQDIARPGHANVPYLHKYGVFDWRGGGRASARETACRVAAGAVAACLIEQAGVVVHAELENREAIEAQLDLLREKGDSIGGVVAFSIQGVPIGWGEPIYLKVEALLASAMLSIPASKGFEMGSGFDAAQMKGSDHNDRWICDGGKFATATNHAGGTLGGIATGMPITGRVVFKPTSSIKLDQESVTLEGERCAFKLPEGSRHDPCVAIRAVPVVKAMCNLVMADLLLLNRCVRVDDRLEVGSLKN
jgi:chorismate synthase